MSTGQPSSADAQSSVKLPDRWITDTPTTARFPHVTRANADEVAPAPISPLGWRIGWTNDALPGVVDGYVRFGITAADEFTWPTPETFGTWGGYFYNQLSLGRLVGVRMPGASAQAIDRAYFGENPDVPPYVADPRDEDAEQTAKLVTVLEAVMGSATYPPYDEYIAFAQRLQRERPDLATMGDAELVSYALTFGGHLRYTWDVYAYVVLGASIGPGAVQGVCEELGRGSDLAGLFGSVGDVVSASSASALWQLSRTVAGSTSLGAEFDRGEDGLLVRMDARTDADAIAFRTEFAELLREHGHRGPNEWDLASPTWRSDPAIALMIIGRLRHQDDSASPSARTASNGADRERLTDELLELAAARGPEMVATFESGLRSGRAYYRMRETGKDAAVRIMDEGRAPLRELGARLAARGVLESADHVFQLLDTELAEVISDPGSFGRIAAERAAIFGRLAELEPPYVVSYPDGAPPIPSWPVRKDEVHAAAAVGEVLHGIGVSSGTATGTARIVHDMARADTLEPGDVMICTTTDPSWVPLFLVAGAVICNVGAREPRGHRHARARRPVRGVRPRRDEPDPRRRRRFGRRQHRRRHHRRAARLRRRRGQDARYCCASLDKVRPCPARSGAGRRWPWPATATPSTRCGSSRTWSAEVLDVAQVRHRHGDGRVQGRRAVGRHVAVVRCRQRRAAQEAGVAAAPGGVELQAVDGVEQRRDVVVVGGVLTGGDVAAQRPPQQRQTGRVVAADRLLEPGDAELVEIVTDASGLADAVRAVGVDHQFDIVAAELAQPAYALPVAVGARSPALADLDLHPGGADVVPPGDLLLELPVGKRREAAGAVQRDVVAAAAAGQGADRYGEQPGGEVPPGDVQGRDRLHVQALGAVIASGAMHGLPGRVDREGRVLAGDLDEMVRDDRFCGGRGVGPADAGVAAGLEGDGDGGDRVPGQRPVGLGFGGGERVDAGGDPVDRRPAGRRPRTHDVPACWRSDRPRRLRRTSRSAARAASAMIVSAGFAAPWVGSVLPSTT